MRIVVTARMIVVARAATVAVTRTSRLSGSVWKTAQTLLRGATTICTVMMGRITSAVHLTALLLTVMIFIVTRRNLSELREKLEVRE
jgi:hypothetical protein